jgi:hypothetical protein
MVSRLLYPLFCAVYHFKFGLPKLTATRSPIRPTDYPKLKNTLETVSELINEIETAEAAHANITPTAEQRKFYDAYSEHWVHADKRTILTEYICKQFTKALRS